MNRQFNLTLTCTCFIHTLIFCIFFFPFLLQAKGQNVVAITIEKIGDDAHLEWRVDEEAILHDFIIERSTDNLDFSAIGLVRPGGSMKSYDTYGFIDENIIALQSPTIYYRVVEIDRVGTNRASQAVSLSQVANKGIIIDHFPNPKTADIMNIAYKAEDQGDLFMQIVSGSGRSMYYSILKKGPGFMLKEVSVAKFPAGSYTIQIFNDLYAVTAEMRVK